VGTQCATPTQRPGQHGAEWVPAGVTCDAQQLPRTPGRRQRHPVQPEAVLALRNARHRRAPGKPERGLVYRRSSTELKIARRVEPRHARVSPDADRRWSWDALAYPDFRRYFVGSVASNLGTWLQNTAQALLAYKLTHSVLAIGAVVCAQFSWVLILGPWTGVIVSRARSLQRLLIGTQFISAAAATAMALLQFAGLLTEEWLIVGALVLGLAYCFALPATSVLVPAFVPEHEIRAAMALDSASYNIGRCAAPLLAVLVVSRIGFGWAFTINAASFLILAAALARAQPCSDLSPNNKAKIVDGWRVVSRDRRIQLLLAIVAAVTITADPVLVLGPALGRHFSLPETWAGYFLSALGFGTLVASFVPVRRPSRVRHAIYPLLLLWAAVTLFALGFNRWLSLAAALVAGMACLLTGSVARALLYTFIPRQEQPQRSAVMAIWGVAWAGTKPLASLADGVLATFVGAWAVGVLPSAWKLPSVQAAGVLLAVPALLPGVALMPRLLRSVRSLRFYDWLPQHLHMGGFCFSCHTEDDLLAHDHREESNGQAARAPVAPVPLRALRPPVRGSA
jgi:MFS family permease